MTDPIAVLLRGVLGQNNNSNPTIAMFGQAATPEQTRLAERVTQAAWGRGLVESAMPRDDDLARVRVTAEGRQYLKEDG